LFAHHQKRRIVLLYRDVGEMFNLSRHEMTLRQHVPNNGPGVLNPRDSTKLDAAACCKASFGSKGKKRNKNGIGESVGIQSPSENGRGT